MSQDLIKLSLDQKPCVVEYSPHLNVFIAGTYQLVSNEKPNDLEDSEWVVRKSELEKVNYRYGKLYVIDPSQNPPALDYCYTCNEGGGVFDLKLLMHVGSGELVIYVAHANGSVGVYEYRKESKSQKIKMKEINKVSEGCLLTSIDIFAIRTGDFRLLMTLMVGCSNGYIAMEDGRDSQLYHKQKVVESGDPVWNVKLIESMSSIVYVIAAAEDCSWSIWQVRPKDFVLIHKSSKDFSAGVTTISELSNIYTPLCDHKLQILLGSYDSTIKIFDITLVQRNDAISAFTCKKTKEISFGKEASIWRVRLSKDKESLLVSAMYSGVYRLKTSLDYAQGGFKMIPTVAINAGDNPLKPMFDVAKLIDKETTKPLLYDIAESFFHQLQMVYDDKHYYCIADFNGSKLVFLEKERAEKERSVFDHILNKMILDLKTFKY